MKKAKDILTNLAAGHGGIFSDDIRQALAQGAAALEFKFKVLALLNETASAASGAGEPSTVRSSKSSSPEKPAPTVGRRLWSPEEDAQLVKEFLEDHIPVELIASNHGRTVLAILMRLQQKHGLITAEQVEALSEVTDRATAQPVRFPAVTAQLGAQSMSQPTPRKGQATTAPAAETVPVEAPTSVPSQADAGTDDLSDLPAGGDFEFSVQGFSVDNAGQLHEEGPDYAMLYEMELDRATVEEKRYANEVLENFKQYPEASRRGNIIRYVSSSKGKMNETLKNALLGKLKQMAETELA